MSHDVYRLEHRVPEQHADNIRRRRQDKASARIVRDAARAVLHAELANGTVETVAPLRATLNAVYDAFLMTYGYLNLESLTASGQVKLLNLQHFTTEKFRPAHGTAAIGAPPLDRRGGQRDHPQTACRRDAFVYERLILAGGKRNFAYAALLDQDTTAP